MPNYTERWTEANRPTIIDPASRNNATVNSDWVALRDYHRAVGLVQVGALAAGATVNASILQAKDTDGTSSKAITGKAITALTDVDDSKIVAIEVRTEELDVDAGFDCIRLQIVTAGGAAALTSGLLIRFNSRFSPVGAAAFDEVVD